METTTVLDTRTCGLCRADKPVSAFSYRNKGKGKLQARCKTCCSVQFKEYRLANLDKFREYKQSRRPENAARAAELRRKRKAEAPLREFMRKRNAHLRVTFGLDHTEYDAILARQGGVCAICGTDDPGRGSSFFHVDHCHGTGKVRGLLCNRCNLGLGYFQDDAERLVAAATYLVR